MRDPKELYAQFNFHPELCVGCDACVGACLDEQDDLPVTKAPLRRVYQQERIRGGKPSITWYSVACLHCDAHPCAQVCPKGCFSLDAATGTVQLDNTDCIGCRACAKACPLDGIVFQGEKADKCDGCLERLKMGLRPRCVDACPRYAITIDDRPAVRAECQRELAQWLSHRRGKA
jgi:Fe-S-cluster-containing dehydrogenase component